MYSRNPKIKYMYAEWDGEGGGGLGFYISSSRIRQGTFFCAASFTKSKKKNILILQTFVIVFCSPPVLV